MFKKLWRMAPENCSREGMVGSLWVDYGRIKTGVIVRDKAEGKVWKLQ
jgi:hypothetical protein